MKIEDLNLKIMGKIIPEYLIYFHFIYFYSRSLSWTTLVKSPTDTPLFWIATPLTLPASLQRSKRSVTVVPVSRGGFGTWESCFVSRKDEKIEEKSAVIFLSNGRKSLSHFLQEVQFVYSNAKNYYFNLFLNLPPIML